MSLFLKFGTSNLAALHIVNSSVCVVFEPALTQPVHCHDPIEIEITHICLHDKLWVLKELCLSCKAECGIVNDSISMKIAIKVECLLLDTFYSNVIIVTKNAEKQMSLDRKCVDLLYGIQQ